MNTRYLLFVSNYEGDNFIGEVPSLDAAVQQEKQDTVVIVVEDGKPPYRLHIETSDHVEPIEGQGKRQFYDWLDNDDNIVTADAYYVDIYRWGEPVPEGYCKHFNGSDNVIMTNAEAVEIDHAEREALKGVQVGQFYTVRYPNGVTVQRQYLIGSGAFFVGGGWSL